MGEQTVITPSTFDESEDPRPVRIQYGDVKMRLPRLDDSTQLPLAMISAGIMIVSKAGRTSRRRRSSTSWASSSPT